MFSADTELPSPGASVPSRKQRLVVALVIGLAAGFFSWGMQLRSGAAPDFAYPHTAVGFFLDGQNPYAAMHGS